MRDWPSLLGLTWLQFAFVWCETFSARKTMSMKSHVLSQMSFFFFLEKLFITEITEVRKTKLRCNRTTGPRGEKKRIFCALLATMILFEMFPWHDAKGQNYSFFLFFLFTTAAQAEASTFPGTSNAAVCVLHVNESMKSFLFHISVETKKQRNTSTEHIC